ncbi:MAG: virulence RhuM family protein [Oscillospiraceae bacterium]|nr:virulence RhuM family protein [Oscillospiraceae bacterium]
MNKNNNDNIVIFSTEDGKVYVNTHFAAETVWLTIDDMARLFEKSRSTINEHILNVYAEGELDEATSKRKIGNSDFSTKPTNYYNLDIIISVGYRVKSLRGTQFRQWAIKRLDCTVKSRHKITPQFKTICSFSLGERLSL